MIRRLWVVLQIRWAKADLQAAKNHKAKLERDLEEMPQWIKDLEAKIGGLEVEKIDADNQPWYRMI